MIWWHVVKPQQRVTLSMPVCGWVHNKAQLGINQNVASKHYLGESLAQPQSRTAACYLHKLNWSKFPNCSGLIGDDMHETGGLKPPKPIQT